MRVKKINEYPDYKISDDGRVFSYKTKTVIELKQRINNGGYFYVNLCDNGKCKSIAVHRLVGLNFIENPNEYQTINHIDANKLNNHCSNLEWCTQQHNTLEASRLGLLKIKRGIESNLALGNLNIDIANVIRERYKNDNITHNELAIEYGVSRSAITQIIGKKIYNY